MIKIKNGFFALASTILCILILGCTTIPEDMSYGPTGGGSASLLVDQYQIGVDDRVLVSVWKNPDLSVEVPVRPDGRISIPLAGEVVAGGRAPEDVAKDITERLSAFIRDPQVSVILVELRSHEYLSRVRVSGAVVNPVSVPYRQGMTVLDLILAAGGLSEFAAGNSAKLYRQATSGATAQAVPIELGDILNAGDMKTNFALEPGDIITVPERFF